ncbi:conserved hypothetical protein [Ricinus communis]|uniref:CopG family transcriptional regulator n=1 Tax=Ricinus communis TaxID=3988 RepID=B9TDJ1_RICCO|nr:conserved hypothetical protein [Ricinus communis]
MQLWKQMFILAMLLNSAAVLASPTVTVYKSPSCGCCEKYISYLRANDFTVNAVDQNDMDSIKKRYGVSRVASCHTALINGYVIEGHVPVSAINKLLKEKPAILGISAPGMPMNSPGMGEMKKGTLTIYRIPNGMEEPKVYSIE